MLLTPKICSIPVPLPVFQQQCCRHDRPQQLGHRRRQPHAGDAPQQDRHDLNAGNGEQEGPGKGQHGGYHPIGQSGKHTAGKDIQPHEQQSDGAQTIARHRQLIHWAVQPGEDAHQWNGRQNGNNRTEDGCPDDEFDAESHQLFQLLVVLLPVVVGDHGGHAVGVADEQGADKHKYIHDDGDGCHTVLAHIFQHRQVEQQGGNARHQGGRQLRHTVGGGVEQHPTPEHRLC